MNGILRQQFCKQTSSLLAHRPATVILRSTQRSITNTIATTDCIFRPSRSSVELPFTTSRSFAGGYNNHDKRNKNKGGGGGGGNGGGGGKDKITVIPLSSPDDSEIENYDREDIVKMGLPKSMDDFFKRVNETGYIGEEDMVKIYNSRTKEWEELVELDQIQREHNAANKVFIAPDYPEEEEDEDYPYGDDGDYGDVETMENTVSELVKELKADGWTLGDGGVLLKEGGKTSTTKDIIIQKAEDDMILQGILLGRIGSLDHISQCLQYKFVWKDAEEEDGESDKADGEM